jgi:arsenate reductase (thioredoxin)
MLQEWAERKGRDMGEHEPMTAQQRVQLNHVVKHLHSKFHGIFGLETIEAFVFESYDEMAKRATVTKWLTVTAEKFALQRLEALARSRDGSLNAIPAVLFLCVHNAGRSQMALGWFNYLADRRAIAWSGGSEPGSEINPDVVKAMAEVGIDISKEFPKPWTDEFLGAADVVVTMGCGDACPLVPGKRYEDWELEDPSGKSLEEIRPIREAVKRRVEALLEEILPSP